MRAKPDGFVRAKVEMSSIGLTAMGLGGEAGEVLEILKKGILHQHDYSAGDLANEIGDCLWYLAGLCTIYGLDIGRIMESNIAKLEQRYPDGWSYERSRNRKE